MGAGSTFSDPPDLLFQSLAPSYQEETTSVVRIQGETGGTEINLQESLQESRLQNNWK